MFLRKGAIMSDKIKLQTRSLHSLEKEMKKILAQDLEDQSLPVFSGGGSFAGYSPPHTMGGKTPEQRKLERDEFLWKKESLDGNPFWYE